MEIMVAIPQSKDCVLINTYNPYGCGIANYKTIRSRRSQISKQWHNINPMILKM